MKNRYWVLIIFFILSIILVRSVYAKVLSADYLQNVVQVNLKNGLMYRLCLISETDNTTISAVPTKNNQLNINDNLPVPSFVPGADIVPEKQEKSVLGTFFNGCFDEKKLIMADLEYVYNNGSKNYVDRLFVFDKNLYRPDSLQYDYFSDEKNQLQTITINELWLTDPSLTNGQQSTQGKIVINYSKENPQPFILSSVGSGQPITAGIVSQLTLSLNGKTYGMEKIEKEIENITLLEVSQPTLTPTPASVSKNIDNSWKEYYNPKFKFYIKYPFSLQYQDIYSDTDEHFEVSFYKTNPNEMDYRLIKNFIGGWAGPSKEETLSNVKIENNTIPIKIQLNCAPTTAGANPEDPVNCTKELSLTNYGSAFIYAFFEKDGVTWYLLGPSWNKGERKINDEERILSQMLASLRFED